MTGASRFDPHNGSLRLTRAAVRGIAAVASGTEPDEATHSELAAAGIVADGELHPRLVPLARCIGAPSVRLVVESAMLAPWALDAWIDESIAVLLRRRSDIGGASDAVAVPRRMVALNLARLVELGPRERVKVGGPVDLDEGSVEALLGSADEWTRTAIESMLVEDEILPEWLEVLSALSGQPKRRWRMGAWWNSAEESPAAKLLEIVEADVGSFLLTRHREPGRPYRRSRLHPLTSTQIWRLLCALVPAPDQVERPLTD